MTLENAYAAARRLHEQRLAQGWRPVGRKIGFTNRTIWPLYGVYEPIWGYVYDQTLLVAKQDSSVVSLQGLAQPRIEPEICFKLKTAPKEDDLLSSVEWVAHSIEIVQCQQPGWKGVTVANSTAENGLHGRLIVGTPLPIHEVPRLADQLPKVEARLFRGEELVDRGVGENVLGSPLLALGYLVDLLAKRPEAPPLAAGEIVTTGTLTDAHPVARGELWGTQIYGLSLKGLTLQFS
jgi:2-keto-4-pentenoate hydratase